jgi:hypothetical protein
VKNQSDTTPVEVKNLREELSPKPIKDDVKNLREVIGGIME